MSEASWQPPSWVLPPEPDEPPPPRRPVLDDLPPWLPGALLAADFAAGAEYPDCACPRCTAEGETG